MPTVEDLPPAAAAASPEALPGTAAAAVGEKKEGPGRPAGKKGGGAGGGGGGGAGGAGGVSNKLPHKQKVMDYVGKLLDWSMDPAAFKYPVFRSVFNGRILISY